MKLSDFDYTLPPELIAQTPIEPRDHSRLLNLNLSKGTITETKFYSILDKVGDNDVIVLNKTRVINARLNGTIKSSIFKGSPEVGGDELNKIVEIFLHKQISDNTWDCLVYPGKKLKPGKEILFIMPNSSETEVVMKATIIDISDSGRIVQFDKGGVEFLEIVEKLGSIPLPPYIKEKLDNNERYQTVFNEIEGSVAAPTAGLHFTNEIMEKLIQKGVKIEKVLLHVGLGTFKGVEKENILEHKMHHEYIELEKDVAERLNEYKKQGKRIIAVGTTSIRVLESFSNENGVLEHGSKDTNIFIYPGYKWKFVDGIITNFHLPKSTLLMLVSSFAGTEYIKKAYKYAVDNKFRFFSFGDAMFIEK